MQAVCMKVVTGSNAVTPKIFGEPNTLTLSEQQHFVRDTPCQSTKWQDMLEIWWGMAPLAPLAWPMFTRKEWKRKNSTYLMFNLPLTKSSQQRKTARHCRTRMKSNIVSMECYVWVLPTITRKQRLLFEALYRRWGTYLLSRAAWIVY